MYSVWQRLLKREVPATSAQLSQHCCKIDLPTVISAGTCYFGWCLKLDKYNHNQEDNQCWWLMPGHPSFLNLFIFLSWEIFTILAHQLLHSWWHLPLCCPWHLLCPWQHQLLRPQQNHLQFLPFLLEGFFIHMVVCASCWFTNFRLEEDVNLSACVVVSTTIIHNLPARFW